MSEGEGYREREQTKGMWRDEGETRGWNFSITAHRDNKDPDFITVCSPEGTAHLPSFISPILSPRKNKLGYLMRFFCCTSKCRCSYHYRCSECRAQLLGEANPPAGSVAKKQALALNFKVCFLVETVQSTVSSTSGDYSYLDFEDVTSHY